MIHKPKLPPVQGYVEVDVDGVRMYREISTGELVGDTDPDIEEIVSSILGEREERAMYYINAQPNESGNYGNPMGQPFTGSVSLPDYLLSDYISAKGFVIPSVENGAVVSLEVNQEALDSYNAEHPDVPEPEPKPTTEDILNALLGVTE